MRDWILHAGQTEFVLLMSALIVVNAISIFYAYRYFYRKRLIEDTPTSRIRSAAQGYVELAGKSQLLPGPSIVAPMSQTPCVWYRFKVEEKRRSGKDTRWVKINGGISDELFFITDGTGECVVDPDGAQVTPSFKKVWYGSGGGKLGTLTNTSISSQSVLGGLTGQYRYTEEIIRTGEELHIMGLFRSEGGAGGNLDVNEDVREMLRDWKKNSELMLERFDTNKDGKIDMEEWEKAREAAYQEVMKEHSKVKASLPTFMIGNTHDRRRPFLLSAKEESDLLKKLQWTFYGLTGLAVTLSLISLYVLQVRL